jgi:hypothetical protein
MIATSNFYVSIHINTLPFLVDKVLMLYSTLAIAITTFKTKLNKINNITFSNMFFKLLLFNYFFHYIFYYAYNFIMYSKNIYMYVLKHRKIQNIYILL